MSQDSGALTQEAVLSPVFEFPVVIRETDLDTFGHVNNAVYLRLFEEARWEIVSTRGYDLKYVQDSRIGPTILEVRLQFRREIVNREKIVIKTWVASVQRKTMTLRQVMVNEKGEEACLADFVIGLFDLSARKLIDPTPEWRKAVGLTS